MNTNVNNSTTEKGESNFVKNIVSSMESLEDLIFFDTITPMKAFDYIDSYVARAKEVKEKSENLFRKIAEKGYYDCEVVSRSGIKFEGVDDYDKKWVTVLRYAVRAYTLADIAEQELDIPVTVGYGTERIYHNIPRVEAAEALVKLCETLVVEL